MIYQRNIVGTSIYHKMSVSQSCLRSFFMESLYFLPNFLNILFTGLPSFFFWTLVHAFCYFVACLVANILANRACSLRLSNIFIATSIFVYQILLLVELLLMSKAVPGATVYKITRIYLNIDHWSIKLYHHTNFHIW